MRSKKPISSFAPHEVQRFILPITFASIGIIAGILLEDIFYNGLPAFPLVAYGSIVIIYTLVNNALIVRTSNFRETYGWFNSILTGVGLGLLPYFLPDHWVEAAHILIILGVVAVATVSGRLYAYISLVAILMVSLPHEFLHLSGLANLLFYTTPFITSMIVVEVIIGIQETTQQHIHQLETINRASRQIMLSLETEKTLALINTTMQDALEADTYFVGIVRDHEIHLDLFYDDGEYF